MSTYAVFGMTKGCALTMARETIMLTGSMSQAEWNTLVDKEVERVMQSELCVQLSDKFDAPQFAKDYISLARKVHSRDLHIKSWSKTGEYTPTGRAKMAWSDRAS